MTQSPFRPDAVHYKVVELSMVTDETIEHAVNMWTGSGWIFDQIQFVVRDASRRPSMAFLFFLRPVQQGDEPTFEQLRSQKEDDAIDDDDDDDDNGLIMSPDEGDIVWN